MADIDYGELFGIEDAADAGAAETPDSQTVDAGTAEKSTEASGEPEAGTGADAERNAGDGADGGQDGQSSEGPAAETAGQSAEENAKYAAARRKAERERDEAIAAAKAEMQKQMDEAFASSGMVNPYTKKPITSKAEYDEYRAKYDEEQRSRVMRKSGMTEDEYNRFVENLPQVREAKEAKAEAERITTEAREREARVRIDEQIREIGAIDPSIKSVEDLTKMENYDQFYALVKKGNTLTDAFKLVNYDRLVSSSSAAARQAALNAANGKAHMGRTSSRGQGAVAVPADVMEQYRFFLPDATDAEIQAHYQKYHRS